DRRERRFQQLRRVRRLFVQTLYAIGWRAGRQCHGCCAGRPLYCLAQEAEWRGQHTAETYRCGTAHPGVCLRTPLMTIRSRKLLICSLLGCLFLGLAGCAESNIVTWEQYKERFL